ncbi:LysR family transcriptional regulator [Paenibacillus sepulcri]|uniref:LysR family transcriptional regulator n=1 Tax=Paenibacillus sepulcri TaxID=359917 RepID=A0ABS7C7B5_9BACL|nr:LysR family transcriptional regulator [Paenibacillus sepulcri]
MELLQLQYFRKVAKLEHMTKAAEELRIAQPALSKTISRLEESVGVPLFDRYGRQIRLNTFGQIFLKKVEAALSALEEGQKEITELAGLEHGVIHLATSALDRLTEPLGAFLSLYPGVNIRLTQVSKEEEITLLLGAGEADICFTALPVEHPEFSATTVFSEDVFLAVPPGHRLAERGSIRLEEVADEPFIGYKEGILFQPMNDGFFRKAGISPKYVCQVDEPASISNLVRAGLGIALIGGCGRSPGVPLHLLRIEYPVCQRNFQIIWHEKRYLSLAARKFRDFFVQYFAEQ